MLAPGADPDRARLRFSGVDDLRLDDAGDLVLETPGGELRQLRPRVYQDIDGERREIAGRYVRHGEREIGFEIDAYDPALPLVIDPVITYSTYLGGDGIDFANAIAVDAIGCVYVTGETHSLNFPVAGYQHGTAASDPPGHVFVTKLNQGGTAILYSAYFGGSGSDYGADIVIDGSGNAYVAGYTQSEDFPTTAGVFQPALSQHAHNKFWGDAFVAKLNPAGSTLVYSTYLGGRKRDRASGIALVGNEAYVTGETESSDFPTAGTPYQAAIGGGIGTDAFVARINSTGSGLVYSTYLGGANTDAGHDIAVDPGGYAYVTGMTLSPGFPTAGQPFQPAYHGGDQFFWYDGFVTKVKPDGSDLVYSTFVGGARHDVPRAIAIDASGCAYIAGETSSTDFPATAGAYQTINLDTGTAFDAFVAKLDWLGSSLAWASYLGGNRTDLASAISVNTSGVVTLAGETESTNFPTLEGACELSMLNGQRDAFVARFDSSGSGLRYSMYLGGSMVDRAAGVAVDSSGNAYVAGQTFSSNFPITAGALRANPSGQEAFITKIAPTAVTAGSCISALGVVNAASYESGFVSPGEIVTIYGNGIGPPQLTTGVITENQRFSNVLADTRVYFDGVAAPLIYVYATQLSAIVPYAAYGRSWTEVRVEYLGVTTNTVRIPVAASMPGIFSLDSSGQGQGAILHPDYSVNGPGNPAPRGSIVVLYTTGEGQTEPPGADGLLALSEYPTPLLPVSVRIGGIEATVLYAGAAPTLVAGVMQVNVSVPKAVTPGDAVPVILKVGERISQPGITLAVR